MAWKIFRWSTTHSLEQSYLEGQYLNQLLDDCFEECLQESRISNSCISTDAPADVVSLPSRSSDEDIEQERHPILGKLPQRCNIPAGVTSNSGFSSLLLPAIKSKSFSCWICPQESDDGMCGFASGDTIGEKMMCFQGPSFKESESSNINSPSRS